MATELHPSQVGKIKKTRITERQQLWMNSRISDPEATDLEITRRAGYSIVDGARASKVVKTNRLLVEKALKKHGCSISELIAVAKSGLHADKVYWDTEAERDPEGKKIGTKVVPRISPDWASRAKFLNILLELAQAYPAKQGKIDHTVHVDPRPPETETQETDLYAMEQELLSDSTEN